MSDNTLEIDDLLNSCTDEKRIDLIKLTQHVAVLTNEINHQKNDISELKTDVKNIGKTVDKMNSKLFIDNGDTSIITQFKNNDIELSKKQVESDDKLNDLVTAVKIIADRDDRKDRFKKWIVPIIISASLAIISILISVNIIKSAEENKYIKAQVISVKDNIK
jgi:hypothetical protein